MRRQTLSDGDIRQLRKARRLARTDTLYLANEVLGYTKVDKRVHGGLVAAMQSFQDAQGVDTITPEGYFSYRPRYDDPINLPGPRRRLFLDARGHYKTTIQTITGTIQWILNFPDIWVLMVHASGDQVKEKYMEVRDHFRRNPTLRYLFPDFCPQRRPMDWGTDDAFTIPCRRVISGTATVTTASIEKVKAGSHYHVIKFFDVVEKENSQTAEQIRKTIRSFGAFRNLLVSAKYWLDVEGTRYHFEDLYGTLIDQYMKEKKEREAAVLAGQVYEESETAQKWHFYVRGCYQKDLGGREPTYQPEELDAKPALDEKKRELPVFPALNSWEDLEAMRRDPTYGPELFAAQMLNNPVDTGGFVPFPLSKLEWVPEEKLSGISGYYVTTVDTAHTVGADANDSVITTCKVDRMQRRYVVEIRMGKWLPDQLIEELFIALLTWKSQKCKIEETSFVLGLKVEIGRKSQAIGYYPTIEFLPRDTHVSKQERILNTLQPWYNAGRLRFSDALPEWIKERVRHELSRFPKSGKDDILDTLADQFAGEEYFGQEGEREESPEEKKAREARELQKERDDAFGKWLIPPGDRESSDEDGDPMTGL